MRIVKPFFISSILLFSLYWLPLQVSARPCSLPANWYHLYSHGCDQLESNQSAEAIDLFNEALEASSQDIHINLMTLEMLEEAYERRAEYKNAKKTLLQSLFTLKQNDFQPRKYVGFIYLKLSLINYRLGDYRRAGFFALLAAPSLREGDEAG